ncbi:hypothetical protein Pve01_69300 [Planomonospora venezuelensis]|nr:hypothetical protein Pve01_69300 [Planomonospora venezuelensis]
MPAATTAAVDTPVECTANRSGTTVPSVVTPLKSVYDTMVPPPPGAPGPPADGVAVLPVGVVDVLSDEQPVIAATAAAPLSSRARFMNIRRLKPVLVTLSELFVTQGTVSVDQHFHPPVSVARGLVGGLSVNRLIPTPGEGADRPAWGPGAPSGAWGRRGLPICRRR